VAFKNDLQSYLLVVNLTRPTVTARKLSDHTFVQINYDHFIFRCNTHQNTTLKICNSMQIRYDSFITDCSNNLNTMFRASFKLSTIVLSGAFAKLQKRLLALSCPSPCPSVRNSTPNGWVFTNYFLSLSSFSKSARKRKLR